MKTFKNETQKFYSGGFLSGGFVLEGFCPGGFLTGVYVRGVFVLEPIFRRLCRSRSHFSSFWSTEGPIFNFLSILGHHFFICLDLGSLKLGFVSALECQKRDFTSTPLGVLTILMKTKTTSYSQSKSFLLVSWTEHHLNSFKSGFLNFFRAKTCCVVCHAYCFCYGETNMARKNV